MSTRTRYPNGITTFRETASAEQMLPVAPVVFYDDFLGAGSLVIPTSQESGVPWVAGFTGSATVAGVADAPNGVVACALTAASQAQTAALTWNSQNGLAPDQGLIFETRCNLSVLPTGTAEIQFGLAGVYNAVPDSVLLSMFFDADGDGAINCATDDDSTDSGAISSNVEVTAGQWKIYTIDCTDVADIKFFIDGSRVAPGTTFGYTDTDTLQPYLAVYKASGTDVATLQVDMVRTWQKRS